MLMIKNGSTLLSEEYKCLFLYFTYRKTQWKNSLPYWIDEIIKNNTE